MNNPPVSFYLPAEDVPPFDRLPEGDELARHPRRFLSPALNWVWRTFHHLAAEGFPCTLTSKLPQRGIIVCAACNISLFFRPGPEQFLVCCVADAPPRFYMPCQVFQSATQATFQRTSLGFPFVTYMPHWPQPGLLPRMAERKDEFCHLDFFGASDQFAPELRTPGFVARLQSLGLKLRTNFDHYYDYRTTDAVLAVRTFGPDVVNIKPASKLINAWRAGAPAILGRESAFRELRQSPLDYLEAESIDECFAACARLRADDALRIAMANHGLRRAKEFSVPILTHRWKVLLGETLIEQHERWLATSWLNRQLFFAERAGRRFGASIVRRMFRRIRGFTRPPH